MTDLTSTKDRVAVAALSFDDIREMVKDSLRIDGKTMAEWFQYYHIRLSADMSPPDVKAAAAACVKHLAHAYQVFSSLEGTLTLVSSQAGEEEGKRIKDLVGDLKERKRALPSSSNLLKAIVGADIPSGERDLVLYATLARQQWKIILDVLHATQKAIEAIGIQTNAEMRIGAVQRR